MSEVSVRVPFVQMSAASVPRLVNVLFAYAHTLAGTAVIADASDEDAFPTTVLVFELMEVAIVPVCESVWAFTTDAIELDAVATTASV